MNRFRQIEYGIATSSGTANATGPFVKTPRPIESQAIALHLRSSVSIAKYSVTIATTMKNVSALSKITVRENASTSGMDRNAIVAINASSSPHTRRANQKRSAAVKSVKRYAGNRAASSVGPSTSIANASAAK